MTGQHRFTIPIRKVSWALCKLTEVTPAKVINDFAKNFGSGGEKDKDQKQAKQKLLEYFIAMGYGQQMYATADIALMFKELEAVHLLWPETAKPKFREKHVKWREKYERYWFKHWYKKPRKRIKTPYYQ